jgi:cytoskeletal protein CcmA (bactofilin family)
MANEFIARKGIIVLENGIKVTGSLQVNGDITASGDVVGVNFRGSGQFLTDIAADSVQFTNVLNKPTLVSSSAQISYTGITNVPVGIVSSSGQVTSLLPAGTVSASSQVSYTGLSNIPTGIVSSSGQIVSALPAGTVSASSQVVANDITGIGNYAQLTGSNNFTAVNTFSNTTNSTAFNNGAVVIDGGLGVAKNVNISGSLNVTGLLTAVSMSTLYVTSSELTIGTSRVIVNDDDNVRFAGLSVVDSGSTAATGSILWDSLKNHWIYEREDGGPYRSAIVIAGPKNYDTLGNEEELIVGRVPVATGGDHIDTNIASSSIRIDLPSRLTHIEAGLYVTGAITSSVGFSGNGANLTDVTAASVAYTNITGLPTLVSASSQVSYTGLSNIPAGIVSSSTQFNNLSSPFTGSFTGSFTGDGSGLTGIASNLQAITDGGASTTNQVTLAGGAIIHGVLFTSSSATGIAGPVTNQVVATFATGSYDAVHFDYVVKDGTNFRTGTVMAVWNGSGALEFTDTSTNDIGNTTGVNFNPDINSGNIRLRVTTPSGTWAVKTAVRMV